MIEVLERLPSPLAVVGADLDRIEPRGARGVVLGHLDEVVDEGEHLGLVTEQVGDGVGARGEGRFGRDGRVGGEESVRRQLRRSTR